MLKFLADIDAHRDLLGIMVMRNIKIRYKRSVLGFFWTLLNPLLFIVIYAVFLKILRFYRADDPFFLPMLVTGVITWQFLSMCLGDSLGAVIGNANLVTKTSFPRIILPFAMTTANLVNFLLSLVILFVYVLALRLAGSAPISFECMGLLPAVIATQFALCLGLGLVFSSLNVFFRDIEHILGVILLAWFFLTPVIYPLENIPQEYQKLAFLNPMTGVVTAYRTAFLGTNIIAPRLTLMSFAICWLVCLIGIVFFQKTESEFVDAL